MGALGTPAGTGTDRPGILRIAGIVGILGAAIAGCGAGSAPVVLSGGTTAVQDAPADDSAFERQLAGHRRRVAGCVEEAQSRRRDASGLLTADFTVSPRGHVVSVEITRDTAADPALTACVRSRLGGLFFDPAPTSPAHRSIRFAFCDSPHGICRLGPARPVAGASPGHRAEVEDLFRARSREIAACQNAVEGRGGAIAEVELTVGVDGRVMSGRVLEALPRETPLAGCALRPLLGATVTAAPPGESFLYRSTIFLRRGEPGVAVAVRAP